MRRLAPLRWTWRRTIVRRGERLAARLFHDGEIGNPEVLRYLNSLSDVLFVAGRLEEL